MNQTNPHARANRRFLVVVLGLVGLAVVGSLPLAAAGHDTDSVSRDLAGFSRDMNARADAIQPVAADRYIDLWAKLFGRS